MSTSCFAECTIKIFGNFSMSAENFLTANTLTIDYTKEDDTVKSLRELFLDQARRMCPTSSNKPDIRDLNLTEIKNKLKQPILDLKITETFDKLAAVNAFHQRLEINIIVDSELKKGKTPVITRTTFKNPEFDKGTSKKPYFFIYHSVSNKTHGEHPFLVSYKSFLNKLISNFYTFLNYDHFQKTSSKREKNPNET